MTTIFCKLIAKETCPLGYTTYVFESLDDKQDQFLLSKYLMCIRFPNWDHRNLELQEEGFLSYKINMEGVDKWFNGKEMVPYIYTNIQFLKFINKPIITSTDIIID